MTYQETASWLLTRNSFLILTHTRPDGDTIGCAAGLCHALREQGKTAYILKNPEATSLFTPYLDGLVAEDTYIPQTVISVDIAATALFPESAKQYLPNGVHLAIDHHPSQEFFAQQTCLDVSCAACGELVYDIICQWEPVSATVALPLYVATSTDTGCFVYGNTTGNTHRVAGALLDKGIPFREINHLHFREKTLVRLQLESLLVAHLEIHDNGTLAIATLTLDMLQAVGATEEDIDDISAFVGSIKGVITGITLRELRPNFCKISLRTKPELLNASHVCALLGGGGHAAASGATIESTPEEARITIMNAIRQIQSQT